MGVEVMTLPRMLERAAETDRGLRFFDRRGGVNEYSYARLLNDSRELGLRLLGQVQPGDRVGLIFSTSYEFVRAFFAVSMTGALPFCLAPPRLGRGSDYSQTTSSMIQRAGALLILCEESTLPSLEKVRALCGVRMAATTTFDEGRAASHRAFPEIETGEPALLQFSSGTTVEPKPVVLSHANLSANTQAILERFPGDLRNHSGISWLPMHHDMGLIGGLFTAVAGKGWGTFVRPEDFVLKPALWLEALSRTRSTISPCPNFALKLCTDRVTEEEIDRLDLSAWQIALVGAETVHLETLTAFAKKFEGAGFRYRSFTPVYGLAEATLAVSFYNIETEPLAVRFNRERLAKGIAEAADASEYVEICSVGSSLGDVQIEIRDQNGQSLPPGNVGRIFVSGSSVMLGYLGPRGLEKQSGPLDTGDLGFFHEDQLFIYGRAKDVIIVNGRNYDPAYIEFASEGVTGIRHERTAAFAVDSLRGTEGFVLIVEKEKGDSRNDTDIAGFVRSAVIAKTGLIPESVHVIPAGSMPRTTSGKVRRQEARDRFHAGRFDLLTSVLE